jgi:hypothetical protein
MKNNAAANNTTDDQSASDKPSPFIPRWESYKFIFNITIFRYLVLWFSLVPILASILKGVGGPYTISLGDQSIVLAFELPFSWQLLWASSFFFFLALAIYFFRCPLFIRKYNNYGEYEFYKHDPRWLVWIASEVLKEKHAIEKFHERMVTKKFVTKLEQIDSISTGVEGPHVGDKQTTLKYKIGTESFSFGMPILAEENHPNKSPEQAIFWEIFACYSGSRLFERTLIYVLLWISGIFFLFVLLPHIYTGVITVLDYFISAICNANFGCGGRN